MRERPAVETRFPDVVLFRTPRFVIYPIGRGKYRGWGSWMIVDQFNSSPFGGAAIAARRLHHALLRAGVTSRFWHLAGEKHRIQGDDSYAPVRWTDNSRIQQALRLPRKTFRKWQLRHALRGRPEGLEIFTSPHSDQSTKYNTATMGADIVHLHWVAKLIDYPSFFGSLADDAPIVWTLHDMNPFTGGCHYSNGCEAFRQECQDCPQLGRRHSHDLSQRFFHLKRVALAGKKLHIVSPSSWLESEARRSQIFSGAHSFQTIHNGIDTELFRPQDKRTARRKLGLPEDHIVIGFGAESIENRRKGFRELLHTLTQLSTHHPVIGLAFGGGQIDDRVPGLPEIMHTGFVSDPNQQTAVYSASDILALPSLQDNLPQTGVEAMACGTPVVAFDTGGISDYVKPQQTGLLATAGDVTDLARKLSWVIDHPSARSQMGLNARELIVREFNHDTQAAKYRALYERLLRPQEMLRQRAA